MDRVVQICTTFQAHLQTFALALPPHTTAMEESRRKNASNLKLDGKCNPDSKGSGKRYERVHCTQVSTGGPETHSATLLLSQASGRDWISTVPVHAPRQRYQLPGFNEQRVAATSSYASARQEVFEALVAEPCGGNTFTQQSSAAQAGKSLENAAFGAKVQADASKDSRNGGLSQVESALLAITVHRRISACSMKDSVQATLRIRRYAFGRLKVHSILLKRVTDSSFIVWRLPRNGGALSTLSRPHWFRANRVIYRSGLGPKRIHCREQGVLSSR
jgi:hypothetical protein